MPTLKILSVRSNRIESLLTCKSLIQQKKATNGLNALPVNLSILQHLSLLKLKEYLVFGFKPEQIKGFSRIVVRCFTIPEDVKSQL